MALRKGYAKFGLLIAASAVLAACNSTRERTNVDVGYYSIKGQTWEELNNSIKAQGPKVNRQHALAAAKIQMKPDITYKQSKDGCTIESAKIFVDAKIKLPKWKNSSKGSKELQRNWGNYAAYARTHEETHVKIAEAHARRAEVSLLALPKFPNCDELKAQYNVIMKNMNKDHRAAQLKFDADERKRIERLVAEAERTQQPAQ